MTDRLTESQLNQIIAEVQQLSDQRQNQLAPDQVKEVLAELNLPPELFDEAMIQVQRRQALAQQNQRRRRWIGGAAALMIVAGGGVLLMMQQQQQKLDRIGAQQDRITLTQDDGGDRRTISRPAAEVYYRVTLKDVPVGQQVALACEWIDPSNQLVQQTRYQTKQIATPVWPTHCRHALGAAAPTGTWKVRMLVGDRPISDATFDVK